MSIATFRPRAGAGMPKRSSTRTAGPNPFIEGFELEDGTTTLEGTVANSWELKQAGEKADFEVEVPGKWETGKLTKGPNVGQEVERLSGDAGKIEAMIRRAADYVGCGVSVTIHDQPWTAPDGTQRKPRKGHVIIAYEAKKRANYSPRGTSDDAEATEA